MRRRQAANSTLTRCGIKPSLEGIGHQPLDGLAASLAVAKRQVVHVHPDELVGPLAIETATELLGVLAPPPSGATSA